MRLHNTDEGAARNASPYLHGPELKAVADVLNSGHYGHTDVTDKFETDVASFLGVSDAVAVASGTTALHIALLAAGVGQGHEVIVPSMTFCATIQAILACGASPRFIEVNPDTGCIDSGDVEEAITESTRAVMPVLYGGRAIDLSDVHDKLTDHRIVVIEDAAHAFGSYSGRRRVGATGALTCFSFGPIKALTCTQGGMLIPRTQEEASAARRLRMLGIAQTAADRASTTSYIVDGFGFRAQLPAINAAIGSVQLAHFGNIETRRKALWCSYAAALKEAEGVRLLDVDVEHSVPSLAVVKVTGRDSVFRTLRGQGIGVGVHYPPNHLQPAFARWRGSLPVTETLGQQIMSLPFHPAMTEQHIEQVATALKAAIDSALRRAVR